MVIVITVVDIPFGKRLEAWDWARKVAACTGSTVFTPVAGPTQKIMFTRTCESLAAFDEQMKKPNPKYEALLKENREKRVADNSVRYIYEELK